MHELSLAAGIFETVREYVPLCRATSARAVRVRVGDLAGVVPDSLEFCFEALVAGTPYRACYLDIERMPARGECAECARTFTLVASPAAPDPRVDETGAPTGAPAGAERGVRGPASDGDGGAGGAKPPGLLLEWPGFTCPACGSLAIARLGGTELQVVDIELDDGETRQTGPIRASGSERAARDGAGIGGPRE
jgi:hydrogenase nickel incorporation protein HypA/HybF